MTNNTLRTMVLLASTLLFAVTGCAAETSSPSETELETLTAETDEVAETSELSRFAEEMATAQRPSQKVRRIESTHVSSTVSRRCFADVAACTIRERAILEELPSEL